MNTRDYEKQRTATILSNFRENGRSWYIPHYPATVDSFYKYYSCGFIAIADSKKEIVTVYHVAECGNKWFKVYGLDGTTIRLCNRERNILEDQLFSIKHIEVTRDQFNKLYCGKRKGKERLVANLQVREPIELADLKKNGLR